MDIKILVLPTCSAGYEGPKEITYGSVLLPGMCYKNVDRNIPQDGQLLLVFLDRGTWKPDSWKQGVNGAQLSTVAKHCVPQV